MYTHQISYESTNNHLGRVHHTFRTTEDAVQMHMDTLMEREAAGAVTNVTVHKLSFPLASQKLTHFSVRNETSSVTGRTYTRLAGPSVAELGNYTSYSDALLMAEELEYAYQRKNDHRQYGGQRGWYGSLSGCQKERFNDRAEDREHHLSQRDNGQPLDTEE